MESEITAFLNEPEIAPGFTLHLAGITYPNPKYRINRRHGCGYYVFEYIVSGHGTLICDETVCEPEAGDVYMLTPGCVCEYFSSRHAPWEKLWLNINGPLIDRLTEHYQIRGVTLFKACPLEKEFRAALEIVFRHEKDAFHQLALAMHGIIARLHEHLCRNRLAPVRSPEAVKLRNHLDSHWQEKFSQQALCALIHKSPAQMQRIFKHQWGISPGRYLQEKRLKMALQYLENTSYTIRQIAARVGFTDEYYFSNWFKQHTGSAPRSYHHSNGKPPAAGKTGA